MAEVVANQKQSDIEAKFREGLADVIAIIEKLAPFVSNVDELIAILTLALENDSQLRIIMGKVIKFKTQ